MLTRVQLASLSVAVAGAIAVVSSLVPVKPALAAAKDESAAEWLPIPKEFNDWREELTKRGLAFGALHCAQTCVLFP